MTFGTLVLRKGSDDESWVFRLPETLGDPNSLICQMIQMAPREGWPAEVGHREGRVLTEWMAESQGDRVQKGYTKEARNRSNAGLQKPVLGLV